MRTREPWAPGLERLLSQSTDAPLNDNSDSIFRWLLPTPERFNGDASVIIQEASSVPLHSDHIYHRLLDRRSAFHQSNGNWRIRRQMDPSIWRKLYALDPFHSLVNAPTSRIIIILALGYLSIAFLYGVLWFIWADQAECGMDIHTMQQAYIFSVQTMMTIGYGASDYFFGDCWGPTITLSFQVITALICESVFIGVLFMRLSRGGSRAATIVFSKNAIIRRVRGKPYFMFQVCELRKHQLIEAHVRCYAIRHERDERFGTVSCFQAYNMRLCHPDDDLGSMLLLVFPSVVVHAIDFHSPFMPPPLWLSSSGLVSWQPRRAEAVSEDDEEEDEEDTKSASDETLDIYHFPAQVEKTSNPVAKAHLPSSQHRVNRIYATNDSMEKSCKLLQEEMSAEQQPLPQWQQDENAMIKAFMQDRKLEIVVLIEGADALTSSTVQARYSYTYRDIVWDHTFANCVSITDDGCALVNFSKFHDLTPVSQDSAFSGPISQHA